MLRSAEVRIVSNAECRRSWASLGEGADQLIEPGMICVDGGDAGPCNVCRSSRKCLCVKEALNE